MNIQSNDFELFDIPLRFDQEPAALEARWKSLQQQIHPDRFATQGSAAQRVAMQWSVRVNEAYRRLKNPLPRAAYLCELHGAPVNAEDNTAMPMEFLAQQMQWREALDDAEDAASLGKIQREVSAEAASRLAEVGRLIDGDRDYSGAVALVRRLMFLGRISDDIENRLDRFEN